MAEKPTEMERHTDGAPGKAPAPAESTLETEICGSTTAKQYPSGLEKLILAEKSAKVAIRTKIGTMMQVNRMLFFVE